MENIFKFAIVSDNNLILVLFKSCVFPYLYDLIVGACEHFEGNVPDCFESRCHIHISHYSEEEQFGTKRI